MKEKWCQQCYEDGYEEGEEEMLEKVRGVVEKIEKDAKEEGEMAKDSISTDAKVGAGGYYLKFLVKIKARHEGIAAGLRSAATLLQGLFPPATKGGLKHE